MIHNYLACSTILWKLCSHTSRTHEWITPIIKHINRLTHPTRGFFTIKSNNSNNNILYTHWVLTMIKMCIVHWALTIKMWSLLVIYHIDENPIFLLTLARFVSLSSFATCIYFYVVLSLIPIFLLILLLFTFCSDLQFISLCTFFLFCLHFYRFNLNSIIIIIIIREYQLYS